MHVAARNSTFSYKGQSPDIRDVAKDLDVHYVLEGSVRKAGNKVRISAQLIDGENGKHSWAERYDRDLEDIFAVQDEITETVVAAIQPEISRIEIERARAKHPDNLDAWDLYQRGMYHFFRFSIADSEVAVDLFRRVIQVDPEMLEAHASLASALVWLARERLSPELIDEAVAAGRRAIELDSGDPAGYLGLGAALMYRSASFNEGDMGDAISTLEHGVALDPASVIGRTEVSVGLAVGGRPAEAIEHILTAIRLSPRDLNMGRMMSTLSLAHFALGDYSAAIEWTTKIRRAQSALPWLPHAVRVASFAKLDNESEARAELQAFLDRYPETVQHLEGGHWAFRDDLLDGFRKAGLTEI